MAREYCWCGGEAGAVLRGATVVSYVCASSRFHDPFHAAGNHAIRRLYISGPMTGYPECNYPAFNEAARRLREAGYEAVNPAEVGAEGGGYEDLLREDIRLLLDCHGVAVLDRWWESTGARLETSIAGHLKLPVRPLDEWL